MSDSQSRSALQRVDQACDDFESAWRAGQQPQIEEYLAAASDPERPKLLRELLALDLELRRQDGEQPTPGEYQARFPEHLNLIREAFPEPSTAGQNDVQSPNPSGPWPHRIGRYHVRRWLGGGSFGDVYLAYDPDMEREVAIKVPKLELLVTAQAKQEFIREARSVARFQHEGIVRAYDFGQEEGGLCYIVYEYIEGTSLKERIKPVRLSKEPLTPEEAARIVAQVAEALHYAHAQPHLLVHRDVKPGNILLDRQGKPKVTDFGLAVREEELFKERGRLAGTLSYMSPEQVRREGHLVDGRTDIYSLGVVLYELLTGRLPFQATTQEELEDQILHREARPPRQIKDSMPQKLERVCLKALSKRVQDRYTTAKDMGEEILRGIESSRDEDRDADSAIDLEEIERRMRSADEDELARLLRLLRQTGNPACVPMVFRCLAHASQAVREQARRVVHAFGWEKVSAAVEELARRSDESAIAAVLDGLAAFEAHPQIVGLLDRLTVLLRGDQRNRTILLLERKRLGLELESVAGLFRDIHSPYRIEKALGQGLFAAAYLAHADGTDLEVVVRVLRPEFVGQPHLRAQFLDLNNRALNLVHENLVLTREARAFPERNIYFAVRDYVDGVTLQKLLEGGKRFEPPQVVQLLRQLLAALSAVHRRGMCHGGVKPSNVFLGEGDRLVLGDLSLAVQGIGVALERLCYDYRYAAPETFRRGGKVGPPSDFYALGCVAYELVCGEPPFVSDNYLELAARHMHDAIVLPSRRGSRLGPVADELLFKLLGRSPGDRYAQAEDVVRVLDRLEASWKPLIAQVEPSAGPLLHDASLARYRGAESVLGFDASASSLKSSPEDTGSPLGPPLELALVQPTRMGEYEVLDTLGRGGMGVVYKARDPRLDRVVALKVIPGTSSEQLSRFEREARAVARLQHANIVQIYDIGAHEGQPFLALEFVGGGSLAKKPPAEGLEQIRAAAETVVKLARAVHHAHEQGIVHRDLKPSNILLTADGQPKIADFGLAKMQEREEDVFMTREGTILGTPAYMAPEQATGNIRGIGPATDIYGLGAILYALLTGRPPFQGESVMGTLAQLATEQVVSPHTHNPAVSLDLSAICLKCLEKNPQKRYSSAQGLAEDLERWLTGQPIQARRATNISRFLRWCRQSLADLFLFRKRA